ncbi:hypothetical protein XENORESO_012832 [Xenotaenia resolanae]|uniref:Uncharacterized protein n=1 Tax=Xenotaenia resolanae TaxID=208358 RepID=A0ABV0VPJ6_9TELE
MHCVKGWHLISLFSCSGSSRPSIQFLSYRQAFHPTFLLSLPPCHSLSPNFLPCVFHPTIFFFLAFPFCPCTDLPSFGTFFLLCFLGPPLFSSFPGSGHPSSITFFFISSLSTCLCPYFPLFILPSVLPSS